MCEVKSSVQCPVVVEQEGIIQLIVALVVVVGLVVVIMDIAELIVIRTCSVEVRVFVEIFRRGAVPCDAGVLLFIAGKVCFYMLWLFTWLLC